LAKSKPNLYNPICPETTIQKGDLSRIDIVLFLEVSFSFKQARLRLVAARFFIGITASWAAFGRFRVGLWWPPGGRSSPGIVRRILDKENARVGQHIRFAAHRVGPLSTKIFSVEKTSRTGDYNVVRCVGFAVGAEGAEGIMVWLAFVFIRPVPWIYTDHACEIARAEMIDQNRFAFRNDK